MEEEDSVQLDHLVLAELEAQVVIQETAVMAVTHTQLLHLMALAELVLVAMVMVTAPVKVPAAGVMTGE